MNTSKFAILALLDAKADKAQILEQLLTDAKALAMEEEQTCTWFAFKLDSHRYGIFDTFGTEEGREAHLNGAIAGALMENADELLQSPPQIMRADVLAAKEFLND